LARRNKGKIEIIGVAGRDGVANMRKFVDRHALDLIPHVADESGAIWAGAGVRGQPTWLLVDRDGSVERLFGLVGEDELQRQIDRLVAT
jgi:peroxiredoxin